MEAAVSIVVDITGNMRASLLAATDRETTDAARLADLIEPRVGEMR